MRTPVQVDTLCNTINMNLLQPASPKPLYFYVSRLPILLAILFIVLLLNKSDLFVLKKKNGNQIKFLLTDLLHRFLTRLFDLM